MASVTTYVNSALSDSAKKVTLLAFTAPVGRAKSLLLIDDEILLITDTSASPTLEVVRGYMGTRAVAHELYAGAEYGNPTDFPVGSKGPSLQSPSLANPAVFSNVIEVTATGSTGTTAALITRPAPAYVTVTGSTGGINLGVPSAGEAFTFKNNMSTTLKLYCVGGTINGTTGTTAASLTSTGNLIGVAFCTTAGAWQFAGNT